MLINSRSIGFLDPVFFQNIPISVIGLGSIGGKFVQLLIEAGFTNFKAYDFDTVEVHNIGNQPYDQRHVGLSKAKAMEAIAEDLLGNESLAGNFIDQKFTPEHAQEAQGIVVLAVDSFEQRRVLTESMGDKVAILMDGRLGTDVGELHVVKLSSYDQVRSYIKSIPEIAPDQPPISACGRTASISGSSSIISGALFQVLKLIKDEFFENRQGVVPFGGRFLSFAYYTSSDLWTPVSLTN